jgi:Na+-translocating ferredoxin:NAD+ oxidoreductase RnfG subunit
MKKITENKILFHTIIVSIVLFISIFFTVLTNAITSPIIANRILDEQLKAYESLVDDIDHFTVELKTETFEAVLAYDENDETIAVIYIATETNQYGDIVLAYSVDTSGKIVKARFLEYQHTASLKEITQDNLNLFIGLNLGDVPSSSDLTSGATGSYDSLVDAFSKGKDHFETLDIAPSDPFSVLADNYAYKEVDTSFIKTENIIQKEMMYDQNNQILGYIYTLFGSGPYQEGGDDEDIQFYVSVNENNQILGVLVLDEEYDHSGGVFFTRIVNYLDSFKGQTLQTLSYDVDWNAGATSGNSKALVDELMQALVEELS